MYMYMMYNELCEYKDTEGNIAYYYCNWVLWREAMGGQYRFILALKMSEHHLKIPSQDPVFWKVHHPHPPAIMSSKKRCCSK